MKKQHFKNLSLNKTHVSHLNNVVGGSVHNTVIVVGTIATGTIIIYSCFECTDILNTSVDQGGIKCDVATINDSCASLCPNICNDF